MPDNVSAAPSTQSGNPNVAQSGQTPPSGQQKDPKSSQSGQVAKATTGEVSGNLSGSEETNSSEHKTENAEQKPAGPIKRKYKVYGKDIEVELEAAEAEFLDKNPKAAIRYQKSLAADHALQETATERKRMAELVDLARRDPFAFLGHPQIGHDAKKLIADRLRQEIALEQMSPEQRELHEARQKIANYEAQVKAQQETEVRTRQQAEIAEYARQFDSEASKALADSGMPKSPGTVRRLVQLMSRNLELGLEIPISKLVGLVKDEIAAENAAIMSSMDAERLHVLLGETAGKKLREYDLAKLTNPGKQVAPTEKPVSQERVTQKLSKDEWKEQIRKRAAELARGK